MAWQTVSQSFRWCCHRRLAMLAAALARVASTLEMIDNYVAVDRYWRGLWPAAVWQRLPLADEGDGGARSCGRRRLSLCMYKGRLATYSSAQRLQRQQYANLSRWIVEVVSSNSSMLKQRTRTTTRRSTWWCSTSSTISGLHWQTWTASDDACRCLVGTSNIACTADSASTQVNRLTRVSSQEAATIVQ